MKVINLFPFKSVINGYILSLHINTFSSSFDTPISLTTNSVSIQLNNLQSSYSKVLYYLY